MQRSGIINDNRADRGEKPPPTCSPAEKGMKSRELIRVSVLGYAAEHAIKVFSFIAVLSASLGIMRIQVLAVEELHEMESAAIHIEMTVPFFKIWSAGLPDLYPGMKLLSDAPPRYISGKFSSCQVS